MIWPCRTQKNYDVLGPTGLCKQGIDVGGPGRLKKWGRCDAFVNTENSGKKAVLVTARATAPMPTAQG